MTYGVARTRWSIVGLVSLMLVLAACVPTDLLRGQVSSVPSDPNRANFFPGNVVTCLGAGFPGAKQVGGVGNSPAMDANVQGIPAPNSGPIQPGQGEEVNVTLLNPAAVIDAVIVKGGPAYNVYEIPTFLPPTLGPPQHYISPFNGGHDVPDVSHWFICYHLGAPPVAGSLTVEKVVSVDEELATPLPTAYSALVNCNDGNPAHQDVTVNLPGGGGVGVPALTGIPVGTVCTVVEQDTGSFPPGTLVTYDPAGADTTGVTIGSTTGSEVTITNEFSNVPPPTGTLEIEKTLVPPTSGITIPDDFFVVVLCDDGTQATVIVPGGGGPGSPTVTATAGALCSLEEFGSASFPAGWVVSFSVNGGPPSTDLPHMEIIEGQTVTVNVINDPTQVLAGTVTPADDGAVTIQPSFTG